MPQKELLFQRIFWGWHVMCSKAFFSVSFTRVLVSAASKTHGQIDKKRFGKLYLDIFEALALLSHTGVLEKFISMDSLNSPNSSRFLEKFMICIKKML